MQGLWLENQNLSFRNDLPSPEPHEDEALIRIIVAGICSTDLELIRGYYPFTGILGHEFVGEVEESPSDPSWIGKRVVEEINVTCGMCSACQRGYSTHCKQRTVLGIQDLNGAFAEHLTLPLRNLHQVPDSVVSDAAVFTEPLAAALEILEQVHVQPSDKVLVIGAGRLGQLIAQVLNLTGCELQIVYRYPNQRDILVLNQVVAIEETELGAREFDIVVEATGSPGGFNLARQVVRPRGTIVLKSTYAGMIPCDISSIVVDEITLVGSRCGPFNPALNLLAKCQINPIPLIDARYPLQKGLDAFQRVMEPGVIKVILENDKGM